LSKLIPFFKLITRRMNVPYELWNGLTSEEIVSILEGKTKISEKELDEREKAYTFVSVNGILKMAIGSVGKEISNWIDSTVGAVDIDVSEFKGQPASPGVVRGKVRIALMARDSHKIKEGEVLVCSMTSPDYVPAMKKSIAIVTDEGGLLCHAAIVSRELGKPCVIGTKIATKVLKDGMEVEVDADEGVIRILERN